MPPCPSAFCSASALAPHAPLQSLYPCFAALPLVLSQSALCCWYLLHDRHGFYQRSTLQALSVNLYNNVAFLEKALKKGGKGKKAGLRWGRTDFGNCCSDMLTCFSVICFSSLFYLSYPVATNSLLVSSLVHSLTLMCPSSAL